MWAAPDDLCPTETSIEQRHTEEAIAPLLARGAPPPPLRRREHVAFARRVLEPLSAPYVVFDSNRAWLIYWAVHALDLLDAPLDAHLRVRAVSTLLRFQSASGGFGGGPAQLPHLMSTYAAVCALAIVGGPGGAPSAADVAAGSTARLGWDAIDRARMYAWLLRLKQPDGSFLVHDGGEVDVRATYCVVVIATLLALPTDALFAGVGDALAACQTFEGGFAAQAHTRYAAAAGGILRPAPGARPPLGEAHGGYAFCALAAHTHLARLGRAPPLDVPALVHWATALQGGACDGGGFRGRTNKLVDGCYGWFCGALAALLEAHVGAPPPASPHSADSWVSDDGADDLFDRAALATYIRAVAQAPGGGLRDKPGKRADAYHTCYNLAGLALCEHRVRPSAAAAAAAAAEAAHLPPLLRDSYAHARAWTPDAPESAPEVRATHPIFNIALDRSAAVLRHFYL